jgi:Raf kinase inhibitor-like YbhB/YbcL family protein
MPFSITSPSFSAGGAIPKKFTCDGSDVSPQSSWKAAPAGTQTFALIVDDPDSPVGTWVHWVLYDVPANTTELPEGLEKERTACRWRAARTERFSQDWIWRPMSSRGKTAPLFFQVVCARHKAQPKGRSHETRCRTRYEGPYPRPNRTHGAIRPLRHEVAAPTYIFELPFRCSSKSNPHP